MSQLDSLFPAPSRPAGKLIPHVLGEVTAETVRAVVECLKDDYEKNHVFFNDKGFHNHTMHFVLALYYLGADEGLIRSVYVAEAANQRKVVSPPEPITHENFTNHLGDEKFYQSYFDFFSDAVLKHGASETIEKYIFADEVNTPSTRLICRFMSVFLHPFIHTGYGFEFNLPGMVAEGLAQTYVHYIHDSEMFAPSLYQAPPSGNSVSPTIPSTQSTSTSNAENVASNIGAAPRKVHALAILHKLYKLRLPFTSFNSDSSFSLFSSVPETAAKIQELVELWLSTLALNSSDDVENAIEELAWTASAVYGVGGWRDGKFKADFFLVHLLTSSLFLPSVAQSLSSASQRKLLGAYFTALLSVYIWRLSPALCFKSFYEASLTSMHPSNSQPLVAHPRFLNAGAQENNLWPGIINNAIHHPEAHVSKAIRALEHWARLYGKTPKGKFTNVEIGWEDAEHIDGMLFVRIASLTVNALGRVADGEDHKEWYNESYTSDN